LSLSKEEKRTGSGAGRIESGGASGTDGIKRVRGNYLIGRREEMKWFFNLKIGRRLMVSFGMGATVS